MPSPSLPFFRGWSRDPVAVGLPFPSSPWTARRLAQATLDAAIDGGGPVLELGAGAGAVTQALIEGGCGIDQLIVIERDAELCRTLERRFHGLCVLHGDALQVAELLTAARIDSVSVVLSGLPMRAVAPAAAIRCYSGAFRLMPQGGAIIQYTYGFKSPVDPGRSPPRLDATFVGREWRNVPPMAIWSYRLPSTRRPMRAGADRLIARPLIERQERRPAPAPASAPRQRPADPCPAPSSTR